MSFTVRLGQDIFDCALQAYGTLDELDEIIVAAAGVTVTPKQNLAITTENKGDERVKSLFRSRNLTAVNVDFEPSGSTPGAGIGSMVVGSTFVIS